MAGTTGMADRDRRHVGVGCRRAGGFTLVEMLAAIAILVFGMTGLVALMSAAVDTRSTAELRDRAVRAADAVFLDLQHRVFPARFGTDGVLLDEEDAEDDPTALEKIVYDPIPGFPRLRASVELAEGVEAPGLLLVTARITWLEAGVAVGEVFQRFLQRGASFPARIATLRSNS